eukprot:TRINITY_DN44279_c0_g1_i2.p1 TRINITY_DN44279_c0_g1~~TRINITY_DN44279_c0_g1_i2.p1  ORF type:complete len:530 (+),score=134.32 TRINITY_DN44279_c0_g1_i2:421-2010(+)
MSTNWGAPCHGHVYFTLSWHEQFTTSLRTSRRVCTFHEHFTTCSRADHDTARQWRSRPCGVHIYGFLDTSHHSTDSQRRDNMPETKKTRGRAKQRRPDSDKPDAETAERDHSPQSSLSSVDVIPETQQDRSSEDESVTRQQKKRIRVSKKEIPDYRWTEQAETRLAELVKENPPLYDKKQKEWLNVAAKSSRWNRVGEQLEPPATGLQCKKHYENMRTRVGKIMKKEKKSGAGQPERSVRDDEIMEIWSFLKQHIVRGETVSSEQFAVTKSAAVTISDDDDDEVRSTGSQSQSQASTTSGKGKGKRSRPPATETATRTADTGVTQSDLSDAVKHILSKADSLGASHSYTGQQKIVHDFACLLEGHMQGIPEDSWHEFQIDSLNLVHRYRQRQQQPPMTWPAPQQQQPLQPPQQQQFLHLAPQQQQQQPQQQPAATWMPPQSPQYSWIRTTQWEPGMPTAPSATVVQTPSPTSSVSSLSASFKTPMTPISFPGLGSADSSLEGILSTTLFTSKELDTPPGSGTSTSKDTE